MSRVKSIKHTLGLALLLATVAHCIPHINRGTTFFSGGNEGQTIAKSERDQVIQYIKTRSKPFIFASPVPDAESVTVKGYYSPEIHVMPIFAGGIVGTHFSNFNNNIEITEPEVPGKIYIIDNVQIEANIHPLGNFWNNYVGALTLTYTSYNSVYEIATITPEKLYEYLTGEKFVEPPPMPVAKARSVIFRGIVFEIKPNEIVIQSAKTSLASSGRKIVFFDRNNREAGTGIVSVPFHTMVKATKSTGTVQKGYTAIIYE